MLAVPLLCLFAGSVFADKQSKLQAFNSSLYSLDNAEDLFEQYINESNKFYCNVKVKKRKFEIFKENLKEINKLNEEENYAVFGMTEFTDMTKEDFKYYKANLDLENTPDSCEQQGNVTLGSAPESFDWRDHGAVTPVKNQGKCGSCWAITTSGNVEGQYAIKNGKLIGFSAQQLVDCDDSAYGCRGGIMSKAMVYLTEKGFMTEEAYPYVGYGTECRYNETNVKVYLSGCVIYNINEEELKQVLYEKGPIAIVMKASTALMHYKYGIIMHCHDFVGYHAPLLVGYGTDFGVPYWIIKNTWGERYGENGYFRMRRGDQVCGLTNYQMVSSYLK